MNPATYEMSRRTKQTDQIRKIGRTILGHTFVQRGKYMGVQYYTTVLRLPNFGSHIRATTDERLLTSVRRDLSCGCENKLDR